MGMDTRLLGAIPHQQASIAEHFDDYSSTLTSVAVDASNIIVGTVLEHLVNGKWTKILFFTQKLHKPETRYSNFLGKCMRFTCPWHCNHFLKGHNDLFLSGISEK